MLKPSPLFLAFLNKHEFNPLSRLFYIFAYSQNYQYVCFTFWYLEFMTDNKKIYFVSDSHLGVPTVEKSRVREGLLVSWLEEASKDAHAIFFLGDIFDFWFEYRTVVPKGFVRLLGKIASLADQGIAIHYFTGNHDMWVFDYFEKELGVIMHREPFKTQLMGKIFYLGHGDGLGQGDRGYKFLKAFFGCRLCQKLFSFLHPGFGIRLAGFFSRRSRVANNSNPEVFNGKEKEILYHYCQQVLKKENVDYFVFGHRHLPLNLEVAPRVLYVNTGDWVKYFSYAVFDGIKLELKTYKKA